MPIDYKEYPANWFTDIRPRILERESHKCAFCGAPNHSLIFRPVKGKSDWELIPEGHEADILALDGIIAVKVILTIAHLDHDHNNSTDDNLAALCQRCHLNHDRFQHANNRKYGRHWRKHQLSLEL